MPAPQALSVPWAAALPPVALQNQLEPCGATPCVPRAFASPFVMQAAQQLSAVPDAVAQWASARWAWQQLASGESSPQPTASSLSQPATSVGAARTAPPPLSAGGAAASSSGPDSSPPVLCAGAGAAAGPKKRGRLGRPPKEGLVVTRKYARLKLSRAQKRQEMADLEAGVAQKRELVGQLEAECDVRRAHLAALRHLLSGGVAPAAGVAAASGNKCVAVAVKAEPGAEAQAKGEPAAAFKAEAVDVAAEATAAAADAAACAASAAAADAPPPEERLTAWTNRFATYIFRARTERLYPSGAVAPFPPGDPLAAELDALLAELHAMPPQLRRRLQATNLRTRSAEPAPADLASTLAARLIFSEKELDRLNWAWGMYAPPLSAAQQECRRLWAALGAEAGPGACTLSCALDGMVAWDRAWARHACAGSGSATEAAGSAEQGAKVPAAARLVQLHRAEAIASDLQRAMLRGEQLQSMASSALFALVGPANATQMMVDAWPHLPDPLAVFACCKQRA